MLVLVLMNSETLTSTLDYLVPVDQGHSPKNVCISPSTLNPLFLKQAMGSGVT